MTQVPSDLKCPLSNTLLREAVSLPCCSKIVNEPVIREELIRSGLRCPMCNTEKVSPDAVGFTIIPRFTAPSFLTFCLFSILFCIVDCTT